MDYSSLIKSGITKEPLRLVVYGKDGVGKTDLASQAPGVIFVPIENGCGRYNVSKFPEPKTMQEVRDMVDWLSKNMSKHQTIVLDSIDWLERLIHKEVEVEQGKEISKIGFNKGYESALMKTRDFIDSLSKLKEINVVVLAHSKVKTFQDPGMASGYDRYQLALRDDTANVWRQWASAVIFCDYEVFKQDAEDRFALGEGKRVMYTEERPSHQAKNRFDLPYKLPLDKGKGWKTLIDAIDAGGASPDILMKEITELLPVLTDAKKRQATEEYIKAQSNNRVALQDIKNKLVAIKNGGI